MSSLELTQQLLSDIEVIPLSKSIPAILPIALECRDFKGFCVMSFLINPISENKKTNIIHSSEIVRILLLQGLSKEEVHKTIEEGREEFIDIKTIASDMISSQCVKEIETWLSEAKTILDASTNVTKEKYQQLASRIAQVRKLYEAMRGYVIAKLNYYQQFIKMTVKNNSRNAEGSRASDTTKVFIVHGHNDEIKEAVARLIEKQNIEAIILHEKANHGDTIIEKFERNSDVGCAICLFTADDIGRANNSLGDCARARQNVIFETGYFMGKLGRDKTIIVAEKKVEIPSDLQGVVYTDTADWRFSVLKELKARGYNIDYNKLD